ncbi:piggyBac transposable element-derived protein 4-like isoform X5 [Pectinophora gossypiella]|uniref:piggyBac transposable element-derived protein 4-like isoform X5 n=1 Tax=Pectinophora gossypiella TaxID=13191 RepID=UPI00214E9F6B|nr:piggyBac transposable element-derived protein 4-like isoform X5 [Pectinophora gossypiella]
MMIPSHSHSYKYPHHKRTTSSHGDLCTRRHTVSEAVALAAGTRRTPITREITVMESKRKSKKRRPKGKDKNETCNRKNTTKSIEMDTEEKRPQRTNKASMKMFEDNVSSRQSTPDPFSDDGQYGSDEEYDPASDDSDSSVVSDLEFCCRRTKPSLGSRSESEAGTDNDDDNETDSFSEASSNSSIFDSHRRRRLALKRSHSTTSNNGTNKPKTKQAKVEHADDSADTISLHSETLRNNLGDINVLEISSLLPDPTEIENMSICTRNQSPLASPPPPDPVETDRNDSPASPPPPDPVEAERNDSPASPPPPDSVEAERNDSPASPPPPDPVEAERNDSPASPPPPDPVEAERNDSPASPPPPNPVEAERNNSPRASLMPSRSEDAQRNNPTGIPEEGNVRQSGNDIEAPNDWETTKTDIPLFEFDALSAGAQFNVGPGTTVIDVFHKTFPPNIIDYIVTCTNAYGKALCLSKRPATRNTRHYNFKDTNQEEVRKFLGLCLLMGQIKIPQKRKHFTYSDPLYYHPIFSFIMSARRFEQILRCLSASDLTAKGKEKIVNFIEMLCKNFRDCYKPYRDLSLDESLLLFRGRLSFRQYIKSKKARYGIKFYELTSSDGYVLNLMMYAGKDAENEVQKGKKTEKLVLHLMKPYLLKGHHLYMDNYYNSVQLSQKLVDLKTHTTGTLRANRKGNPQEITKKKLKRNQHVWMRKNKVYVSKWVDKRPVLMVTTSVQPKMKEVSNRFGKRRMKPEEVAIYNQYMSGIDRADQMISYYSSPRKSLRWYKKVLFHLLDVAVWNAFFIYRKYCQDKCDFLVFRDELIRNLLNIQDLQAKHLILDRSKYDNRRSGRAVVLDTGKINEEVGSSVRHGHWPEKIPVPAGSKKNSNYLKCKLCTKKKIRKETGLRCKGCDDKPALCALCFEEWHSQV